jgi:hypothetical protein
MYDETILTKQQIISTLNIDIMQLTKMYMHVDTLCDTMNDVDYIHDLLIDIVDNSNIIENVFDASNNFRNMIFDAIQIKRKQLHDLR